MVRAVSVAPSAAAIENPRLMIALIAVTDAQTMNGSVIQPLTAWCSKNPVRLLRQTNDTSCCRPCVARGLLQIPRDCAIRQGRPKRDHRNIEQVRHGGARHPIKNGSGWLYGETQAPQQTALPSRHCATLDVSRSKWHF